MPKPPPPIYGWPEEKSGIRKHWPELVIGALMLVLWAVVLLASVLHVIRGC